MALQFVLGSSGSGKSTWLYERIVRMAKRQPGQIFYVIVPEQFTMQTQRELVQKSGGGIMNIDVVSFQRLAYRVFDEIGKQDIVILEETGKNLLLRKVAEEHKDKLRVLSGNMKKMGYVSEMKSLISELTQYHISPEDLEDFLDSALTFDEENAAGTVSLGFSYKMKDILTMYREFEAYLSDKLVTAEAVLDVLADVAEQSSLLNNSVLALDGFTGFTPIQNYLMKKLMRLSKDIYITLTIDPREDFYHYRDMQELFAMSKKTIASVMRMAGEAGMDIEKPIILQDAEKSRFSDSPMLASLEQNLFRLGARPYEGDGGQIGIYSLANPKEELVFVAGEIKRLVREKGYRYKDFAVVSGDVEAYGNYVPQVFSCYDIPYFLDTTKNILLHPFIEFVRAVLEIVESDFSCDSVFRYLRSNLTLRREGESVRDRRVDSSLIDRLENYILASGIRGHKAWSKRFSYLPRTMTQEQLEELETFRAEQMELLLPLWDVFVRKHATVREQSMALYRFLRELEVEQQLKEREIFYRENGDFTKEREYAQIYRILMDLLDKMTSLLEGEELTVKEYAQILDAGFDAARVGVIPSGYDRVTVGDIERTRLAHVKVLFFVGLNNGIVPKSDTRFGILSQMERQELAKHNLALAPTARERVFMQRFYLYLVMTKPSDILYLLCARVGGDGQALRRSYLLGTVQKLFPDLSVQEIEEMDFKNLIVTPKSSLAFYLDYLRGLREEGYIYDKQKSQLFGALGDWYQGDEEYLRLIGQIEEAAKMHYQGNAISSAVAKALYGSVLKNSVTRLERFASCACEHFLRYGLCLSEREISQFAAMDMGSIYHLALEKYAAKLAESEYDWFTVEKPMRKELVALSLREAVLESGNQALAQTSKNQYFLYRMQEILQTTVRALTDQVRAGKFVPEDFEISFAFTQELDAVNFALSEEEKMHLQGRIDRVDTYREGGTLYVKVIDYKSGNTNFDLLSLYHGLQLQLVVYLNAAVEVLKKEYPDDKVLPAGIFYYHIDDPVVEGNGGESETEIYEQILEKLRPDGLINAERTVYEAMDNGIDGKSKVIPVTVSKDKTLSKASKAVTEEEFEVISAYVDRMMKRLGKRMVDGEVKAEPYQLKEKESCTFCPYAGVCGFDRNVPGYQYRRLEDGMDREDILKKMAKENTQEENE